MSWRSFAAGSLGRRKTRTQTGPECQVASRLIFEEWELAEEEAKEDEVGMQGHR